MIMKLKQREKISAKDKIEPQHIYHFQVYILGNLLLPTGNTW